MKKVIRDGKVAVLYSPGYGAGWYSWTGIEETLFDPAIVEIVEQGYDQQKKENEITEYCKKTYGDEFYRGAGQLAVAWLPCGTEFKIEEYDGNESITLKWYEQWNVA